MIVVKLMGGLGNQMFQYATGRALAIKHKCPLFLNLSFLEAETNSVYTKRNYELNQFCITSVIATPRETAPFEKPPGLFKKLFSFGRTPAIFNENGSSFNTPYNKIKPPVYLNGFWQSEKYFSSIKNILLNEFTPAYEFSSEEKTVINEVKNCNSVSIHVRRGDYVHLKSAAEYHGTCSMDYYNSAVEYMKNKITSPYFYIFSDDLQWCRENFKHLANTRFVDGNTKHSSFDLYLMSCCKHNIIANSSYSWWGAWLNSSKDKIVIAPKKWFAPNVPENKDLLPANYVIL